MTSVNVPHNALSKSRVKSNKQVLDNGGAFHYRPSADGKRTRVLFRFTRLRWHGSDVFVEGDYSQRADFAS